MVYVRTEAAGIRSRDSLGINEGANQEGEKRGKEGDSSRRTRLGGPLPQKPPPPPLSIFHFAQQIHGDHDRGLVCPGLVLVRPRLCIHAHSRHRRLDKEPRAPREDCRAQVSPLPHLLSGSVPHANLRLVMIITSLSLQIWSHFALPPSATRLLRCGMGSPFLSFDMPPYSGTDA